MNVPRSEAGDYALAPFVGLLGLSFCTVASGTVAAVHLVAGEPRSAVVAILFALMSAVAAILLLRRT